MNSGTGSFYIHKDEVMYGPDTAANLRHLCEAGWLRPDDLVWEEGAPEWTTAGVAFANVFRAAAAGLDRPLIGECGEDDDEFFRATAVPLPEEKPWPWGSLGIAMVAHVAVILLVVGLLQFFPIRIDPYASPPQKQEPPLEVAMVTEPEPPPPPPPTPPDPTPPPPDLPPPPPVPTFAPDLPPPPPAPVEMPIPSVPVPALPTETMLPDEVVAKTAVHPTPPHPHKVAQAAVAPPMPVTPQEAPPANPGQPEYLADPRPVYPYAAKMRHQEGTVILRVTLDEAGNPTNVTIEQSSGSGQLDEAAQKKVAADWRFKPGQGSVVFVPVEFHLDE